MLQTYLQAGYPGIILITPEEARAEAEVAEACTQLGRQLHAWSSTEGLCDLAQGQVRPCADPIELFELLEPLFEGEGTRHVVLLRDFQLNLDHFDPMVTRRLRDLLRLAKAEGHALILAGCRFKTPPELEHELVRIELPLPGVDRLAEVVTGLLASSGAADLDASQIEPVVNAALGLTTVEAENAFALSLVNCGRLDPAIIAREKARTIRQGGVLEVIGACPAMSDVGGLDVLKRWLQRRACAFGKPAQDYGLPVPKGVLIAGVPGTGKSLTAKAVAGALSLPLLRLDAGRLFGGLVGQSEANLRSAIAAAEAIAPCVLWIDEIEKGFSPGAGADGGTSARVFGGFLSWMQEKTRPVFVVATANDVSKLPPEFLRKGRFDEMFFVDLPEAKDREAIWTIVISRSHRDPSGYELIKLAEKSAGFTGAEIESVWSEALHEAFASSREPSMSDVEEALGQTVPLARLAPEKIEALRFWAKGRTRSAASTPPPPEKARAGSRRIESFN